MKDDPLDEQINAVSKAQALQDEDAWRPAVRANREVTMRWIVDAMNVIGSRPDGWWNNRRNAMPCWSTSSSAGLRRKATT